LTCGGGGGGLWCQSGAINQSFCCLGTSSAPHDDVILRGRVVATFLFVGATVTSALGSNVFGLQSGLRVLEKAAVYGYWTWNEAGTFALCANGNDATLASFGCGRRRNRRDDSHCELHLRVVAFLLRFAGDGLQNRYLGCDMSVSADNWALYLAAFAHSGQ
jgi:hypothetical protein